MSKELCNCATHTKAACDLAGACGQSTAPAPGADKATDELLPCPFCGGSARIENGPPELWYGECADCGIDGKIRYSRQAAADVWNQRYPIAAGAPVQSEPNMLWEADDPEDGVHGDSPKDFAENYASNCLSRGEMAVVNVLCATRSNTREMRISVAEAPIENWLSWEWISATPQALDQSTGDAK